MTETINGETNLGVDTLVRITTDRNNPFVVIEIFRALLLGDSTGHLDLADEVLVRNLPDDALKAAALALREMSVPEYDHLSDSYGVAPTVQIMIDTLGPPVRQEMKRRGFEEHNPTIIELKPVF